VLGEPRNDNPDSVQIPTTSAEQKDEQEADALYARGMAHYRRREWNEAKACFERLKAIAPERRVVDALLNEVEMFIQLPAMRPEQPKTQLADAAGPVGRAEVGAPREAIERPTSHRRWLGPAIAIGMSLLMIVALALYATGTLDAFIGNQRQARHDRGGL
jgi:tetratricopeptide (TPR) repeat protein